MQYEGLPYTLINIDIVPNGDQFRILRWAHNRTTDMHLYSFPCYKHQNRNSRRLHNILVSPQLQHKIMQVVAILDHAIYTIDV